MVFVRVHLMKERLTTAQKEELGAKLVQAVSEVENLVNNPRPMSPAPTPTPASSST
jgi:hypothetical protein